MSNDTPKVPKKIKSFKQNAAIPPILKKKLRKKLAEEGIKSGISNTLPTRRTAFKDENETKTESEYGPHAHLIIQERKLRKKTDKHDFTPLTESNSSDSEPTLNESAVKVPINVRKTRKYKQKATEKAKELVDSPPSIVKKPPQKDPLEEVEETLLPRSDEIAWQPNNQKQVDFLSAWEDEVLFLGGRGASKSDAFLMDPLRYVGNGNFRGLIIRKTMPELRELIDRCKKIYPLVSPGTKWREQEKMFVFPSGSRIEFGYCEVDNDIERYQGQEYSWIGVDELGQFGDPTFIDKLKSSLRGTDKSLPYCFRATSNPSGKGVRVLKNRWVDLGPANETIYINKTVFGKTYTITRKWIHATVFDNHTLLQSRPEYVANLASIDNEVLRRQWLHGEFVTEGMAFDEFERKTHVIEPFDIPRHWVRFRACDFGFGSMSVCLWFAIDFDGTLYAYREIAVSKKDAEELSKLILAAEKGEYISYGVLDSSVWHQRGQVGETPAETMINMGLRWMPADRHRGSRVPGKLLVHKYLKVDPDTGHPKLKIFSNCIELIKELENLTLDSNNPEDVDTKQTDHAYDALRYGLSSRPESYAGFNYADFDFSDDSGYNYTNSIIDTTFGA